MTAISIIKLFFVVALLLSYFGVDLIRRFAERRKIMDIPNERSSHSRPTPRGGGLAIVAVVLGGTISAILCQELFSDFSMSPVPWIAFLVGGALVAGISFLDDLYSLSNKIRFACHILAAAVVLVFCGHWETVGLPFFGNIPLGWIGYPITFFWIISLINVYNFMDGIDGIAGIQALTAGGAWFAVGMLEGMNDVALCGALIAGSSIGFLFHNWHPARIFMGDVGSAFLGFVFAFLAVFAAVRHPVCAVVGILVVWPFVFDGTFTILCRLRRGENIFHAHRSHIYQRLVSLGWSHTQVSLLYGILGGLGSLICVLYFYHIN